MAERPTVMSRATAYATLTQDALLTLWRVSDLEPRTTDDPELWGCCPRCCVPCAALLYLDRAELLDTVLREWPEGIDETLPFRDGRVDREWMYRQWSNPYVRRECGHEPVQMQQEAA